MEHTVTVRSHMPGRDARVTNSTPSYTESSNAWSHTTIRSFLTANWASFSRLSLRITVVVGLLGLVRTIILVFGVRRFSNSSISSWYPFSSRRGTGTVTPPRILAFRKLFG